VSNRAYVEDRVNPSQETALHLVLDERDARDGWLQERGVTWPRSLDGATPATLSALEAEFTQLAEQALRWLTTVVTTRQMRALRGPGRVVDVPRAALPDADWLSDLIERSELD
jgi:hypothetical protein